MPWRAPRWLVTALLALIVVGGTALRLVPFAADPQGAFLGDAAFHIRMAGEAIAHGVVPGVDLLADAPQGRDLDRWLPLGWYPVVGAFHHAMTLIGSRDPRTNALVAQALAGGLIALPVALAAFALTRRRDAALAAALAAVVLPAHVHRTWCFWFRYEAIGTLTIAAHLAFGLLALAESRPRARIAWSALTGLSLVAALAVWRVAFMIPPLETAFAALALIVAPASPRLRAWFLGMAAGGTVACLAIGYLRAQAFVFSPIWIMTLAVALVLASPVARAGRVPRTAALVLAVAVGVGVALLAPHGRQYVNIVTATFRKIGAPAGLTPMSRVALSIEELAGSGWTDLFGAGGLSWLAAGLVVALAAIAWLGRSARRAPGNDEWLAGGLLAWLAGTLFAITVLFTRNKVVFAPVVAIGLGWATAALARRAWPESPRTPPAGLARVALAVLALAIVGTTVDAVQLVRTRSARLDADFYAALRWLTDSTPADAMVLSTWERGYEIQSWAGRRTLVDGLLEDDLVQERVPAIAAALLQPSGDSLAALCRREGAHYVLVPPSTYMLALLQSAPNAMQPALASTEAKVAGAQPLAPEEARPIVIGMMVLGTSPPPFTLAFEQGGWRVYALPEMR